MVTVRKRYTDAAFLLLFTSIYVDGHAQDFILEKYMLDHSSILPTCFTSSLEPASYIT